MKILAIGDITGPIGCNFLKTHLHELQKSKNIDITIANGENSAAGNGITPVSATFLFKNGVNIITTGNHAFRKHDIHSFFNYEPNLIRPANYPDKTTPGSGICKYAFKDKKVYVINLMGNVYLDSLSCPFEIMDKLLNTITDSNIVLLDFHAEATSEKKSLAYYLDGRISAMFGTHTHVPTADECILPKGTGYITDVGMTGPIHSSLGVDVNLTIKKIKTKMPVKFEFAQGACRMDCIIFNIDDKTGKTMDVERISVT